MPVCISTSKLQGWDSRCVLDKPCTTHLFIVLDTGASCLTSGIFRRWKTRKEVQKPDLSTHGQFCLGNGPKEEQGKIPPDLYVPGYTFSGGREQQSREQKNKACGLLLSKIDYCLMCPAFKILSIRQDTKYTLEKSYLHSHLK